MHESDKGKNKIIATIWNGSKNKFTYKTQFKMHLNHIPRFVIDGEHGSC